MKTKEELEQIKNEYVKLKNKLAELSEEELAQVTGGIAGSDDEKLGSSVGCFPGIPGLP